MADKETEALLRIKTILDDSGLSKTDKAAKDATKSVENIGKQSSISAKLLGKLAGAGAIVGAAFKAIQGTVRFISSSIMESVQANDKLNAKAQVASEQWQKFKSFVGDTLVAMLEGSGIMDHMGEIITGIANAFNIVVGIVKGGLNAALSASLWTTEKLLQAIGFFSEGARQAAQVVSDMRDGFNESAKEAFQTLKWNSQLLETQKNNTAAIKEREAAEKAAADAAKKAAEQQVRDAEALAKFKQDLSLQTADNIRQNTQEILEVQNGQELVLLRDKLEQEMQMRQDALTRKKELLEEGTLAYSEVLEQEAALREESEAQQAALADREAQIGGDLLGVYATLNKQKVKNALTTYDNITQGLKEGSKEQMVIQKAQASAQALMSTYQMANAAYSALAGIPIVGPALGIAAAGLATAYGLSNVASIAGIALKDGGLVKATTGGVPAIIGEGGSDEAVLPLSNKTAMRQIGGAIAEQSGGLGTGGGVTINVNVSANGGLPAFLNELTEATRAGVSEALQYANLMVKTGNNESGYSV